MTLSEQVAKLEKELAERTTERMACYEQMCEARDEAKDALARLTEAQQALETKESILNNARILIGKNEGTFRQLRKELEEVDKLRSLLEARNSELNELRASLRKVMVIVRDIPYRPV